MERQNFLDRSSREPGPRRRRPSLSASASWHGCGSAVPARSEHRGTGKLCEQGQSGSFLCCVGTARWFLGDLGRSLCTHGFPAMGDVPYQDPCLQACLLAVLLSTHGAGAGTCVGLGQCRGDGRVDPWALLAHGGLALAQKQPPQTCTAALYLCIPAHSHHVFIYRGRTDPTLNWA